MASDALRHFRFEVERVGFLIPIARAAQVRSAARLNNLDTGVIKVRCFHQVWCVPLVVAPESLVLRGRERAARNTEGVDDRVVGAAHVDHRRRVECIDHVARERQRVANRAVHLLRRRAAGVVIGFGKRAELVVAPEDLHLVRHVPVHAIRHVPVFESVGVARDEVVHVREPGPGTVGLVEVVHDHARRRIDA